MISRILQLARSVIRSLRRVNYYSASPEARRSHPGTTRALVLAIFAAGIATYFMGTLPNTSRTKDSVRGLLYSTDDGAIVATISPEDGVAIPPPTNIVRQLGTFACTRTSVSIGWPSRSLTRQQPWRLDLDSFDEPSPRTDTRLAADDPFYQPLARAFNEINRRDILPSVEEAREIDIHHPASWITNFVIAYLICAGFFVLTASIFRPFLMFRHNRIVRKRKQQRRSGKCLDCGYDLRGLEFSERCPECGTLAE